MLAPCAVLDFAIGEISRPTRYFVEASRINFLRSARYGCRVPGTAVRFQLDRWGVVRGPLFRPEGRRLPTAAESLAARGPGLRI